MSAKSETLRTYAKPYRPWPISAYNRMAGWKVPRPLNASQLLEAAQKTTGLSELSSAPLMEPLVRLCEALNTEAQLSPFGRIIQSTRLKTLIINRLRLDAIMRRHPEILDEPEPEILLIAGLARTGTTLLHRSLAADPNARALPSWEALNPAPLPNEQAGQPTKRRKRGELAARMMSWLAPDFAAVHPVGAHEPEEDILLLDLTMISQTAEAVTYVPSYSAWLETIDHRPAYAYFRNVLKVLNWLRPGTHWVLKTPNHSEQLSTVFDIFPKATVLQTHRDPRKTMASCCSLMSHTVGLSSDRPDALAIGRHWLHKSERMARKATEARLANPGRKVLDIYYHDLTADPEKVFQAIYQLHGSPLTEAGLQSAIIAAQKPRPFSAKRHVYSLSDFGITESKLLDTFDSYMNRYSIPHEDA